MSKTRFELRRRRRSAAEIASLVAAFRRSGQSPRQWAEQEHVGMATVYRWLRQAESTPPPLVPVRLTGKVPAEAIRFVHPRGWRVELPASLPAAQLLPLLAGLAAC